VKHRLSQAEISTPQKQKNALALSCDSALDSLKSKAESTRIAAINPNCLAIFCFCIACKDKAKYLRFH